MTNNSSNNEQMRLQKFLARSGAATSRRHAEELIVQGKVFVDGSCVRELGSKVSPNQKVCVEDKQYNLPDSMFVLMLHKPAGYVSTMEDPQGRRCVKELIDQQYHRGLFHIGRLDRDTSGLLLFSNDGELGHALLHPSREIDKTYLALVKGVPTFQELEDLRSGVSIGRGQHSAPAIVAILEGDAKNQAFNEIMGKTPIGASGQNQRHGGKRSFIQEVKDSSILQITIHEGKNREVRRMCEAIQHQVIALHRQKFGPISLGDLKRGSYRELSQDEIDDLRALA